MPSTLRLLLERRELGLTLLAPTLVDRPELSANTLERALEWVHSSDLLDPTPLAERGQLLLTTGAQLQASQSELAEHYIARLIAHGVAALGVQAATATTSVSESLAQACSRHGLPLLEIPRQTSFTAVARAIVEMTTGELRARDAWLIGAQRAVSLAALRPNGLNAGLHELSKQLGSWVALFDARGALDRVFPPRALGDGQLEPIRQEAKRMLAHARRASGRVKSGPARFTLQTLGRSGRLRGVLAVGSTIEHDQAKDAVLAFAVPLFGLALEQSHSLDRAHRSLRKGLLHALRGGDVELVQRIAAETWGGMPSEPVRTSVLQFPTSRYNSAIEYLEQRAEESRGAVFFSEREGHNQLLVCLGSAPREVSPDSFSEVSATFPDVVEQLCSRFEARAGVSSPGGMDGLARAERQAEQAFSHARDGAPGWLAFESVVLRGVLGHLSPSATNEVARSVLEPVSHHDTEHGTALLHTLQLWLEHNCQHEPASRALGVHRHTVRSRIAHVERLLGRDLGSFQARAELWVALLAADSPKRR